ncbi:MAG: RusA family crossover junction endodeoxyribonuclease [Proteobacteria bacterium]|nr:RusA family crossover junction endodeoxyribonuclease [Pseudomonadota bacterium]
MIINVMLYLKTVKSMSHQYLFINGVPYSQNKARGNKEGPKEWTDRVIQETKQLEKVKDACILKVSFLLPPDKFPKDFPFGPDLDNLLKRFLDALTQTVFSEAQGNDSCVISMNVSKVKVESAEKAGVLLEILPISVEM